MYDIICKLLKNVYTEDEIGQKISSFQEFIIPIIKVERVNRDEFYSANEQGLRPSLQIKISALNYNNEESLVYMGKTYSIIRTQMLGYDELLLICERKIGND